MKICVLNASNPGDTLHLESDEYTDFRMGRSSCFEGQKCVKQCRSWHGWAYALESEFFVYKKLKWEGVYQYDGIVILVNRDMHLLLPLIKKLKLMKKKVAISFHEGVQDLIGGSGVPNENLANRWISLYDLVQEADFYVNLFGQMTAFFEGWFGRDKVKYCSHGAPIDWDHGFSIPFEERPYDILIGTRTLNQRLSRNTLIAIGTAYGYAKENGKSIHYLSEDGDVSSLLKRIGFSDLVVHVGPKRWEDWLKFLAQFRVIVHADQSLNLGQICYDAAMVGVMPIGSTTWNNMLLGTDDMGDSELLESKIHQSFENNKSFAESQNEFKKMIHPDYTKEKLLRIFK